MNLLLTMGFGLGVSLMMTPVMRWVALNLGVVDQPNHRKVHKKAIPRLGGVAVYIAWLSAITLQAVSSPAYSVPFEQAAIVVIGLFVVLFGVVDDWIELSGRIKLLCQILAGTAIYLFAARIDLLTNPFGGVLVLPMPVSFLITVCWVVGMMNAMNLIDGLDGLASGITVITCGGLIMAGAYVNNQVSVVLLAGLMGACFGFLFYNFHPAKIFLGDSGSQFIGFVFACAALVGEPYKAATAVSFLIPLSALLLPIYDTALAIFRRIMGHQSIFRADKYHLHHRLIKMGMSQPQAVLFFYSVTLYFSIFAVLFVLIPERYALVLLILLIIGIAISMQALRFVEYKLRLMQRSRTRRGGIKRKTSRTASTASIKKSGA